MPFPPPTHPSASSKTSTSRRGARGGGASAGAGSHEAELDLDKTVEAIRAAERALDPLLHSVALLSAERAREEAALAREYRALRRLEANARAQVREWRERGRREHVLAAGIAGGGGGGGGVGSGGVGVGEEKPPELEIVKAGEKEGVGGAVFKVRTSFLTDRQAVTPGRRRF